MAHSVFVTRTGEPAKPQRPSEPKKPGSSIWVGIAFVAPLVIILLVLVGYPTVASMWYSFTDLRVGGEGSFVGAANYVALFGSPAFYDALANLILIIGASLLIKFILGLAVASLLNRPMRGRGLWRAMVILPWAMPGFVAFMAQEP